MKRIGLYIHIPFCMKKCNYCDFVSVANHLIIPDYIKALSIEIQSKATPDFQVDTIYLGGGTPSILNAEDLSFIFQSIKNNWQIEKKPEITIEINPGTVSDHKIQSWLQLDINRVNLGVQSFHDHLLQQLGRIHNAKTAHHTIQKCIKAGFKNIGLDLIYGIFDQRLDEWQKDLQLAMGYHPQHLSCYSLTYEPGTPLYRKLQKKQMTPLPDTTVRQMMYHLFQLMKENKYDHYEISNFASSTSFRSKHNQKYWNGKPYIGLGASSHSFFGNKRFWNISNVDAYIQKIFSGCDPVENVEHLTIEQQMIEFIFLGLRQREGILIHTFENRFPYCFAELFSDGLKELESEGYLEVSHMSCRLSDRGTYFLDSICQRLIDML
jgi:oxygen-independent coproporphyrinogen-3 oxidase